MEEYEGGENLNVFYDEDIYILKKELTAQKGRKKNDE